MSENIDTELRDRIVEWAKIYIEFYGSQAAFSRVMEIDRSTVSLYLNKSSGRTPGLDFVYRMHRKLGANVQTMFKRSPSAADRDEILGKHESPPAEERSGERTANPDTASPVRASRGGRGKAGRV